MQDFVIRRQLRPSDAEAIPILHDRIYAAEYGLDKRSQAYVERAVQRALARGWPERAGAVWLVEREGELAGSLALTIEREGVGAVRWFVLSPGLRGRGLGRALFAGLLAEARASDLERLELDLQPADGRRVDLSARRIPRHIGAPERRVGPDADDAAVRTAVALEFSPALAHIVCA